MARYSCVLKLPGSADNLRPTVKGVIDPNHFDLIYDSRDYWVAREIPGEIPFERLVTVEMLLDWIRNDTVQVTCIAKNEELPLQSVNHCQQVFVNLQLALNQLQGGAVAGEEGHRVD